jgi:hypothetical protein
MTGLERISVMLNKYQFVGYDEIQSRMPSPDGSTGAGLLQLRRTFASPLIEPVIRPPSRMPILDVTSPCGL